MSTLNPDATEFKPKGESRSDTGKGKEPARGPIEGTKAKPIPKPRTTITPSKRLQETVDRAADKAVKKQTDQLRKIDEKMNNRFRGRETGTSSGTQSSPGIKAYRTQGTNTTKSGGGSSGTKGLRNAAKFAARLGSILGGVGAIMDPLAQVEAEKIKAENKLRMQGNDLQFKSDIETRRYKAALKLNETRQLYSVQRMNSAFKHQSALLGVASEENMRNTAFAAQESRRNVQFSHDIKAKALRESGLPSALLYTGVNTSNRTSQHLGGRNFREFTPLSGTQFSGTYMQKALGIGEVKNGNFYDGRNDLATSTKKNYRLPKSKKESDEKCWKPKPLPSSAKKPLSRLVGK